MEVTRTEVVDAAIGVAIADRAEGLQSIHSPGCAAAIWRRQPTPGFQVWLDGLEPDALPCARLIIQPNMAREAISVLCEALGPAASEMSERLVDDICGLIDAFAQIMPTTYMRVRLDVISGDACKRFHIDRLSARLICTFRGTGTQYGISVDGQEPRRVFTVPTGAPIVLRGTDYPGGPASGLLHRSPPIAETGETRLVLVLDPVEDRDGAV